MPLRTAVFKMCSAGNSASTLGRVSLATSIVTGNYKIVLPRLPSGNTVLNSVFLHADLAGRPYRAPDFRDALLSVLDTKDILGAGQYQMSHLWLVTCANSLSKQKLVHKGELLVKGLKCLVIDPESRNIKMKLLWLPPHLEQKRIVESLEPYGMVQSITREMWRCEGMESWQMTNRDVEFTLKEGLSTSSLPHLLTIFGHQCLLLIPGRPPLCLRCNTVGHIRRQCKTPRCAKCHRYGHNAEACVGTYADKLRDSKPVDDDTIVNHLMDVSEVVDASGEAPAKYHRAGEVQISTAADTATAKVTEEQTVTNRDKDPCATWAESLPFRDQLHPAEDTEMTETSKKRPAPADDLECPGKEPKVAAAKAKKPLHGAPVSADAAAVQEVAAAATPQRDGTGRTKVAALRVGAAPQ
ncbi:uncharacterized protein LOC119436893 [Dermacentor silvarum]|uniref:uncharacterized protein LOC119436893 n=1 Tax=Dermacentor silvarum TaxID=543639 RepID=UPI00189AA7BA|nr:uncharacterized protein LOC119436893 [Dermacentor silvarum]